MSFELSSDYRQWLQQLKSQFQHTQQNAVRAVNTEMLKFYWQLGEQIVEQQQNYAWGDGFLKQLSHDLMMEFPEMKGFSKRNLEYIRRWYLFWSKDMSIAQQVVAQLGQIPWGHHTTILDKCKDIEIAKFYHTKLHCYVVIELKVVEFEPEHIGKLNFYIKAVDEQIKSEYDQPTIGLLLCKSKDHLVAQYALSDVNKPIGVSAYELGKMLPSVEQLENELNDFGGDND